MTLDPTEFPKVLTLYLKLSQYPILGNQIRKRMRQELFERGIVSEEAFDSEVLEKALQSQSREGLQDPIGEEAADVWSKRLSIIRDHLTDFYFAYNLPHDLFEDLVRQVLAERVPQQDIVLTYHPELAPWDILFAQGEAYESLPPEERERVAHHLEEIKVVLIKTMINDHLEYLGIAKEWFDIEDLKSVRARRIGRGKIGGKAAGLALADTVLKKSAGQALLEHLCVPDSWFLGADVFYQFIQHNDLLEYANQKYRSEEEIREAYPTIVQAFGRGRFQEDVVDGLRSILDQVGKTPLIVRSSSLLEDSFGTSFAGKYESFFCPNQGSNKENLGRLIAAICGVYASVYSPEVLLYRGHMGLLDYDERMAILIQEVQGSPVGHYYMPCGAGVAFSRNQFRWSPRIDREAGFVRLVYGLGTRAVENLDGDYPRLVALSHPELRPEVDPKYISAHSQVKVDLIDLEADKFRSLPLGQVIGPSTPHLPLLVQRYQDGHLFDLVAGSTEIDPQQLVLTFNGLLGRTSFADVMRRILQVLETAFRVPVDTEFTLSLTKGQEGKPRPVIHILQCRPLSRLEMEAATLPTDIPDDRRLFISKRLVPDGRLSGIRYVVYVSPDAYRALESPSRQKEVAQLLGRLNKRLQDETYMLMGPGRWGSTDPSLGIPVTYADIYNANAIVEMTNEYFAAEPSYGTHFFQDLVERRIYPLALSLDDPGAEFRVDYLESAENVLPSLLPEDGDWRKVVLVVDVPANSQGAHVELVMDGEAGAAMAYVN